MKKGISFAAIFLAYLSIHSATAQEVKELELPQCLHGTPQTEEMNILEADNSISGISASAVSSEEIINDVLRLIGLQRPIYYQLYKGFKNACAEVSSQDLVRRIYVDEDWLNSLAGDDYWVKFFWVSHEVGHHLNAHSLAFGQQNPWQMETQADFFAARLFKLAEGDWEALTHFFDNCPLKEAKSHPPCYQRKATVYQAYSGDFRVAALSNPKADQSASLARGPSEPIPGKSTGSQQQLDVAALQRIKDAFPIIETDDLNQDVYYDFLIQSGHLGRNSGSVGVAGERVNEQEISAYVGNRIVQNLREKGFKAGLVGADPGQGFFTSKIFLALHTDGASEPACQTGPSLGYPYEKRPVIGDAVVTALATALGYRVTDFTQDNSSQSLRNYYFYPRVLNAEFKGLIEMAELTCLEQEVNLINNVDVLVSNLTKALEFSISGNISDTQTESQSTGSPTGRFVDNEGCLREPGGAIVSGFRSDCIADIDGGEVEKFSGQLVPNDLQ